MNRAEFMRQLEILLQDISFSERREALQYYDDYFNDAGEENEQDVIAALGSPARVAQTIKKELNGGSGENIYEKNSANRNEIVKYGQSGQSEQSGLPAGEENGKNKLSTETIVLIIVLCVLASPILLGVGSGALGILIGLVAAWFGLILGFGIAAVILILMLLVLTVGGIMKLISSPFSGIGMIGGGLICGGLGILFLMLTVAMAGIATPAIWRGTVKLCRNIGGKHK
ncbi:MAG: DUF1700 domain-containing protein [Bacteroidales bacterium]|nr:DUF1700 domain-containing protein [Lachnoclostridium sp.]MCM1385085.1 DUF1700 domain-containing protein [Lachnoclostridium sp.]MCM1466052.1 DUF1700 domain-containing protein [Bacteroidales bacterium]